jgi:hypothetical protein
VRRRTGTILTGGTLAVAIGGCIGEVDVGWQIHRADRRAMTTQDGVDI